MGRTRIKGGCLAALAAASCLLTGCHTVGDKAASLSLIYGAAAVLSALLLVLCCVLVRRSKAWFVLLFASVTVVNVGYTMLALAGNLQAALAANRVAYLGSVLLPLSMLMIVLRTVGVKVSKRLTVPLFILAAAVFALAASPGYSALYYKEVTFAVVDGVGTLQKVYGVLHPLYLVYLVGYFAAMVAVTVRAAVKKTVGSAGAAAVLAIAVLVNLGVWLIEQLTRIDFEFLSVSYIISEMFLLGLHLVVTENHRLKAMAAQQPPSPADTAEVDAAAFAEGLKRLTPTERLIFDAYCNGETTKVIMQRLHITENTLKFHNKNLYGKLGVRSRKQLCHLAAEREE